MKKSLLAVAAMTAFAGAAQAQSSVTVYGLIDAGVGSSSITSGTGGANTTKQNFVGGFTSSNGTGMEAGSRLGFRGTEDLGGGLAAGFVLETGVNFSNTQSTTTAPVATDSTLANGSAMFGNVRNAYASLGNKSFGELRIGTQDSLAKNIIGFYDPTKEANITGGVSLTQQGLTTSFSQAATYQAPTMSGVTVRAQYANDGSTYGNVGTTNVSTTNNAWSASAKFDQGPLSIGAVYESRLQFTPAAGTASNAVALLPNLTSTANQSSINSYVVAAEYDLKVVKPAIQYYNQKWNSTTQTATGVISGIQAGLTAPVTPTVSLVASYISGKITNAGSDLYNTAGYQAQVNYALSKRSRLYGIWGQTNWNSQRVATTADVKAQQYGIGMLHTF
jgi:predicted porin